MGAEERKEMLFWTREEYTRFSEAMMDKPLSFYAFEVLYWCGVREGELLALTPADFDFEKRTVSINKSYQRLNKQDVITTPKTPKSNRVIQMPQFLCDELQDYLKQLYGVEPDSRMFPISKSYLHREMDRGCKQTGVKRIRIHDLRHSHISLLIDMGFTALAIAERVGHESIDITYRYRTCSPRWRGGCRGRSHISALFQHLRIGFKLALKAIAHRDLLVVGYLDAVDQPFNECAGQPTVGLDLRGILFQRPVLLNLRIHRPQAVLQLFHFHGEVGNAAFVLLLVVEVFILGENTLDEVFI